MAKKIKKRIVGYWCTGCEKRGVKSFFFGKEGYCDCMREMGISERELGTVGKNTVYGFTKIEIKKSQKHWKPAYIEDVKL